MLLHNNHCYEKSYTICLFISRDAYWSLSSFQSRLAQSNVADWSGDSTLGLPPVYALLPDLSDTL